MKSIMFLLAAGMLAACAGSTPPPATGGHNVCAGAARVTGGSRQGRVLRHLDLDGQVLIHLDFKGDVSKAAATLNELMQKVPREELKFDTSRIKPTELAEVLGLTGVEALGLSSVKEGEVYRNKAFLMIPGPRRGLLKLFGGEPRKFEVASWAPADVDVAFEQDLRLRTLAGLALELVELLLGEAMLDRVNKELDKPAAGAGVTYAQLIQPLDTRLYGFVRVNPGRTLKLKDLDYPLPHAELLLAADGLEPLFKLAAQLAGVLPMIKRTTDGTWDTLSLTLPPTLGLSIYEPVLARDIKRDRIYLATSPQLLKEATTPRGKVLAGAEEFRRATRGLAEAGHSLAFLSAGLVPKLKGVLGAIVEKDADAKKGFDMMGDLLMPAQVATASTSTSTAAGLHFHSNGSSSHKASLFTVALYNPVTLGVLSAVAVPAFIKYLRKSEVSAVHQQLQRCAMAARNSARAKARLAPPRGLPVVCPRGVAGVKDLTDEAGPLDYGAARAGYDKMGWLIQGDVHACYQYRSFKKDFTCEAWTDLDGDRTPALHSLSGTWDAKEAKFIVGDIATTGDDS